MNMRKKLNSIRWFSLMFYFLLLVSCNEKGTDHDHSSHVADGEEYICPMRCEGEKTYDEPRNCPVCNMKLEVLTDELIQALPANKWVLSRQATTILQSVISDTEITAPGYIVPAKDRNQSVAARFGGRVETLYVKFNNQYVKKGEKIMDIYSPELAQVQEEHLLLLRSEGERSLLQRSRERLRLLGITENQIGELEKNNAVALTLSLYSPANGYVIYDSPAASESNSTEFSTGMTQDKQSMEEGTEFYRGSASQIREGMYINKGQSIFSVNDLRTVWAMVSVPHQFIESFKLGEEIELFSEAGSSKRVQGKILLIEQTFEEAGQKFGRARILVDNEDNSLKINSLVKAQLSLSGDDKSQVPSSAVFKTGLNAYVWVKFDSTEHGTGIFKLRRVITGASDNGMTVIQDGLLPTEKIAMQAGLMADSETFK